MLLRLLLTILTCALCLDQDASKPIESALHIFLHIFTRCLTIIYLFDRWYSNVSIVGPPIPMASAQCRTVHPIPRQDKHRTWTSTWTNLWIKICQSIAVHRESTWMLDRNVCQTANISGCFRLVKLCSVRLFRLCVHDENNSNEDHWNQSIFSRQQLWSLVFILGSCRSRVSNCIAVSFWFLVRSWHSTGSTMSLLV